MHMLRYKVERIKMLLVSLCHIRVFVLFCFAFNNSGGTYCKRNTKKIRKKKGIIILVLSLSYFNSLPRVTHIK